MYPKLKKKKVGKIKKKGKKKNKTGETEFQRI